MAIQVADNEEVRVAALCALNLLDTPAEERFDRITRLAAQLFDVPTALISLVDADRQWFKSRQGAEAAQTPRAISFCSHAILGSDALIIEDARLDPRFADNPMVTEGGVRFYAGQPIFTCDGHAVGTLCIVDTRPRRLSAAQADSLRDLACLVEEEISKTAVVRTAADSREALRRSQARFRAAFEQAAVGMAQVDLDGNWMQVNNKLCEILGYERDELMRSSYRELTHPQDLERDVARLRDLRQRRQGSYTSEKRYRHKNGRHVWVNLTVSLVRSEDGTPEFFIAVVEDIQAKKDAEFALQSLNQQLEDRVRQRTEELQRTVDDLGHEVKQRLKSEERLRTIADNLPVLIAYIDEDLRYRFANAPHWQWYGVCPQEMIGKTAAEVYGAEFCARLNEHALRCLGGEAVRFEQELERDGERRIVETLFIPHLREGAGKGIYVLSTDVTTIRRQERQLQLLARTDTLTLLPNRRSYEEKLQEAAARAQRLDDEFALMYIDVDFFKGINDTLGHAGGDELLKEFARRLKSCVRSTDTVCRLAGDEFTVILEGLRRAREATMVADKILSAIREPFIIQGVPTRVSASIGIALSDAGDRDAAKLEQRADVALYRAKARGRDSYHLHGSQGPAASSR